MKYVAAALLLKLAGQQPSADGIKKILASVGADADDAQIKTLVDQLSGKDIDSLIKEGRPKLANLGGGGGGHAAAAAPAAAPAAGDAKGGKKPEEKKAAVVEEEEEAVEGGFGLFD